MVGEFTINENRKLEKDLSLDDMVGRYSAFEKIDSVKLKHEFKDN